MAEQLVSIVQKHTPIVDINPRILTRVLNENRYPLLRLVVINDPKRRREIDTLGQNQERNGKQIVVNASNILQGEEIEDFVYSSRQILENKTIKRPDKRKSSLLAKSLIKIYSRLSKEHPESEATFNFSVSTTRRDRYLQASRDNFNEYAIHDKKTRERVYLNSRQAKERAERTLSRLVGINLKRNVGAVLAHEYGHSSPQAKEDETEFKQKHIFRKVVAEITGGLGFIGTLILCGVFNVPGIPAFILSSIAALGAGLAPYIPLLGEYVNITEKSAFSATSKDNIEKFASAIKVNYSELQKQLFANEANQK